MPCKISLGAPAQADARVQPPTPNSISVLKGSQVSVRTFSLQNTPGGATTASARFLSAAAALTVAGVLIGGCEAPQAVHPVSLQTPRAIKIAHGPVCMRSVESSSGVVQAQTFGCENGARGAIGLVANQDANFVSVVDMGPRGARPRLVDVDPGIPGVTGIAVGNSPTDIAAADRTTAYVLNQADANLSVIDLWNLQALPWTIDFERSPTQILLTPTPADATSAHSRLAVALTQPARLWLHPGVDCRCPATPHSLCTPDAVTCSDVPSQADGEELALPGNVADMVASPDGRVIHVVYQDQPFSSVIALSDQAPAPFDGGCLDGGQAPCEVARIGLTYDCSNGVDDDADGLIDQKDPQCFDPLGFESPDGIGRSPQGSCADGVDDDGDGLIDRNDPNCLWSGDDEDTPPLADARPACSDGRDNDGDGNTDYPADPACYGKSGQTEQPVRSLGFSSISIDPFGKFIYVVDRANAQVLVVDATRAKLIDAWRAGGHDRRPFASKIGVAIPGSPLVATGRVAREITWRDPRPEQCDPRGACSHAVVRYDYNAYVATDGGQAFVLNTLSTFCEITAPAGESLLANSDFYAGSAKLEASVEKNCLTVPAFPIEFSPEACQQLDACNATCKTGACAAPCDDLDALRQTCFGARVHQADGVRMSFNPIMELRDDARQVGRVRGLGTCDTPERHNQELRAASDAAVDTSCASPARPQPVAPGTSDADIAAGTFERAHLLQNNVLWLIGSDQLSEAFAAERTPNPYDVVTLNVANPADRSLVNEGWSVTWEGVLPNTRREDALMDAQIPGQVRVAGLDLCKSGVEPGDRFTLLGRSIAPGQSPDDKSAKPAPGCEAFDIPDKRRDFLTWTIAEVRPRELALTPIAADPNDPDAPVYAQELPTRACFAQGMSFEIRAHDEWIVVGDRSGFLSRNTSLFNTCQPVFGADSPRFNARVKTGARFDGPYLSFVLREGLVPPSRDERELAYRINVENNYRPAALRTTAMLPTDILIADRLLSGPWLMIADPSSNFVYFNDLSRPGDDGAFLLQ